jgi:hypothetical protein
VFLSQFFSTNWGYGVSVAGPDDGMPFGLGWAELMIAAIAVIAIRRFENEDVKLLATFFAAAAFIGCFLMTQRAHAIWEALPPVQYVAFPWRLLAPVTCCMAILTASVVLAVARLPERWRAIAVAACAAAIVLSALPHAVPASYLSLDPLQWTPQQIAARGAIPATFDTFEPRWVVERPTYRGEGALVTRGTATTAVTRRTPEHLVVATRASSECEVELPIAYFPGWRLRLDGVEQPTDRLSSTGRMRVTVAAGAHTIDAAFHRTPLRWGADLTSAAALLLTLFALKLKR